MKTKKAALIICAVGSTTLSLSAVAQTITFTNGSATAPLNSLTPVATVAGTSATYSTTPPGYWALSSPDNASGNPAEFNQTASIQVPNGLSGASLGTLGSLLAQGAAGNVSFFAQTVSGFVGQPGGGAVVGQQQFAYFDITLTDPNNPANTLVINSFSDNTLGFNGLNLGQSTSASVYQLNGTTTVDLFEPWTTVQGLTPVSGDPTLANWTVSDVGVAAGGWFTDDAGTEDIASVTVPTVIGQGSTPDAASTLPLLGVCFGALAGLRRNLRRG